MDPIAHASIALLAKPVVPRAPLWALVAAAEVPDALFFAFEAAGLEHQAVTRLDFSQGLTYISPPLIPWSHGLFMCIVWSVLDCRGAALPGKRAPSAGQSWRIS